MIKVLLPALLLTGCTTVVPVAQKFPSPPAEQVTTSCPVLKPLSENPQLSDVAKSVAENYTLYHECAIKVDSWNEWYARQKEIFERLK